MNSFKSLKNILLSFLAICFIVAFSSSTYANTNISGANGVRYNGVSKSTLNTNTTTSNPVYYFYNWSGYAATGSQPFNEVQMTYTQPAVKCTTPGAWTLFWVGFDGFQSNNVEQAGTAAQCDYESTPQPIYYAWWEMYPTNYIQVSPLAIKPGDTILDHVRYIASTNVYSLSVTDKTTAKHFTQNATCDPSVYCARASADWVVERPSVNGTYQPLANWGSMNLSAARAANTVNSKGAPVTHPISYFSNNPMYMVNDPYTGKILAQVSPLNNTGTGFSDTWLAAQ